MSLDALSDVDLVAVFVGKRAARKLGYGNLLQSINEHPKLAAALELAQRALRQTLQSKNALNSPSAVRDLLKLKMSGLPHEVFVVLFMDAQNRLIADEEMFRGTLTQTSVYPREVVKRALYHNAGAVILSHCHPSGVCEPSHADETLTQALKQALALVDVRVLDHFICANNQILSFAERNLL